ncbi:MAG: hypothetical protein INF44_02650 [Thalassospira sp.]|jgi:hypothetical protein|nr:hypothetical protein [Thalassospira sp.]
MDDTEIERQSGTEAGYNISFDGLHPSADGVASMMGAVADKFRVIKPSWWRRVFLREKARVFYRDTELTSNPHVKRQKHMFIKDGSIEKGMEDLIRKNSGKIAENIGRNNALLNRLNNERKGKL